MITKDFFHANPKAAYLFFAAILIFILYLFLFRYRQRSLKKLGDPEAINNILHQRPSFNYWRKVFVAINIWIFATLALMDPKGNARYPDTTYQTKDEEVELFSRKRKAHEVIFLLDTSASMNTNDMRGEKTRMEVAKEVIEETIRRTDGETVSLYTFTSEGQKVVPSTLDHLFTRLILRSIESDEEGVSGTDLREALSQIMKDYPAKPDEKLKTLIIFSDGEDILYEEETVEEKKKHEKEILSLIGDPQEKNLRIYTIGMGTKEGGEVPLITYQGEPVSSKLDPALLQLISQHGKGSYYVANRYDVLSLAKELSKEIGKDHAFLKEYEVKTRTYLDQSDEVFIFDRYYQRPLLIALILLGLFIILPENWRRPK